MKHKVQVLLLAAIVAGAPVTAQSHANGNWVGIWHAHVDGQPTDTLTLATDTGAIGGTIVLDMVSQEEGPPRVIAGEPHVLLAPHLDGDTLSFQVKMRKPDGTTLFRDFIVTRISPDKAQIHCTNCGPGAPAVELTRDR